MNVTDEIIKKYKKIVIIGHAYVGKTKFLAEIVAKHTGICKSFNIIFSDWYIYKYDFIQALYVLVEDFGSVTVPSHSFFI